VTQVRPRPTEVIAAGLLVVALVALVIVLTLSALPA